MAFASFSPDEEGDDDDGAEDAQPDLPLEHGHELEDGLFRLLLPEQDRNSGLVKVRSNEIDHLKRKSDLVVFQSAQSRVITGSNPSEKILAKLLRGLEYSSR